MLFKRKDIWYYKFTISGKTVYRSTGTTDKTKAQEIADKVKANTWDIVKGGGVKQKYIWQGEFENKGVFLSGPKELDLIRARKAQKEMNSNLSDQPVFQLPKKKKICHICNGVKKIGIRSCSKCSGKGYL